MFKSLIAIAAVAGLVLGGYLYYFSRVPIDASATTKKVEFDLLRGMRPTEISNSLEKAGLIRNATAMVWLGKITGGWVNMKAADYELSPSMSPEQIFKILKSGIGIQRAVLVREGDNIYQIAEMFENSGILNAKNTLKILKSRELIAALGLSSEGIRSLEGYLFPNTYFYDRNDQATSIIHRMVDAFLRTWTPEFEARAKELGMTRLQVVTLASIIEKETGASFERPIISSVFHNRLRKHMRIQSDPTVIYGIWERYDGNIRRSDLQHKTEYNTYMIAALPIGPISNPHPDSIRAALYPGDTEFLYFMSKWDGTHVFSKTYEEHAAWVKKLSTKQAREGKSWRDLKATKSLEPEQVK
ncbi:MAG: endolytic transglycosylase MltG [Bdellovibrionales bacterium]|nr:endolytic transglycosylase MltG [Bdellovibrionales bacterium]